MKGRALAHTHAAAGADGVVCLAAFRWNAWWKAAVALASIGYAAWALAVRRLTAGDTLQASAPYHVFIALVCAAAAWRSKCTLHQLGLRVDRWRADLAWALGTAAAFALGLVALTVTALRVPPQLVFERSAHVALGRGWAIVAYAALVPFQDFACRSCLQNVLQARTSTQGGRAWAATLASLVYATSHVPISPRLAWLVLAPSLAWGWMFSRSGSLVGPAVSHQLTGLAAFYVVGFPFAGTSSCLGQLPG
jgi:membrane protease YdiL (CAAX protease family)